MPSTNPIHLDPELAAALAAMPRGANGSVMDLTDIPELRRTLAAAAAALSAVPLDPRATRSVHQAVRPDGSTLDLVAFRPAEADGPLPVLLWFHAGGQVVGSAHDDDAYHGALALALDCVVVAVDYRLAPETQAPGAAEDGLLAWTSVRDDADALAVDPGRVGIAGASGGGAPAAATALMVRDRAEGVPCLLSLSYAMLDDRNETPSSYQITDLGIWDRRENLLAWEAVLGVRAAGPDVDAYCAPGRATVLAGMPATFVAVAEHDVLRDEGIAFASGLLAAGVSVELHVYPGTFHAWDRFAPTSRLTQELERQWHAFLRRRLHA